MTSFSAASLASRSGVTRRAAARSVAQAIAIFGQVLPPAHAIDILKQHLDLAPDEQSLKGGIIDVDIVNGQFIDRVIMRVDLGKQRIDIGKLAFNGQGKRCHRAFHPLEDVDPQKVDEAFLAIDLTEKALAAANLRCCIFRRRRPACAAST